MRRIKTILLFILILILSCQKIDGPANEFNCEDQPEVCELATSNNEFGWEIFKKLSDDDPHTNLFISPLSIATAFGMLLNGAHAETRAEILEVMRLNSWNETQINDAFKSLIGILPELDPSVAFNLANSIWYRDGFQVLDEFLEINDEHFLALIRSLDFDDPSTKDIINGWIEDQTSGKIKDMIDQVSPQTVMFLINAIYFYGQWQYQFDPDNNSQELFYPDNQSPVSTEMMSLGSIELPYYSDSEMSMLGLPYGNSTFSMTLILPKGQQTLNDLIENLEVEILEDKLHSLQVTELSSVTIPKFKIEYKNSLVPVLSDLGMEKVFEPFEADFSGINGTGDLFVSDVIHQSFIEVDEAGTEAAAATVIVIDLNAAGSSFNANKPFLFLIRDQLTGSILFAGKYMKPE